MDISKKEIMEASPINVGEKEEVPTFKRDAYGEILSILEKTNLNLSITGLRRVGKTTLIKQVLNEWKGNAFYFSFDEARYQNYESLKRVVEVFLHEGDKPLIVLDEVGKIKEWGGLIKKYYDRSKARFIVSGSSSLSISKGRESLAGRIFDIILPPLQYNEFIRFVFKEVPISDFSEIFKRKLRNHIEEFFSNGSFPEIAIMEKSLAQKYVRDAVVTKIIFEDIPDVFKIEYKSKLYDIFMYMVEYSGNLLYESNLAELLNINKTTVKEYIFYLEQSFLSYLIYNEGSFAKKLRKTKKAYVASPTLYNSFTSSYNKGSIAEVAVFDKLLAIGSKKPFFYRDAQKREVDFVFKDVPIEVKFKNAITKIDLKWLLYYLKKKDKKIGVVITKNYLDERELNDRRILFIPLHVFLSVNSFQNFPS